MPPGGAHRRPRARRTGRPVFAAAGARVLTLPVSLVCGLVGTRLTITSLGATEFGVVSLIVTLQLIFTFLDLGTGAAVLNEAARFRVHGDHPGLLRTWTSARRVSLQACLAVFVVSLALSATDSWPGLLGVHDVSGLSLTVAIVVGINLVARPALLALAALQGLGRAVAVVMLQLSVPVVSLLMIVIGAVMHAPLAVFAASLAVGQLVCGFGALAMVSRRYRLPVLAWRGDGTKVQGLRSQSGPMLVINLIAPLGMGLDRLALSHLSSHELKTYALIGQLLAPVFSLGATLTQGLWGDFSQKRHDDQLTWRAVRGPAMVVAAGAAFCGLGFATLMPWVGDVISKNHIHVGFGLSTMAGAVAFLSLMMTVPGALMTSARGLSVQARVLVVTVSINVALTWGLAPRWGAASPLFGSLVGGALQWVILAGLSRSHLQGPSAKEQTR